MLKANAAPLQPVERGACIEGDNRRALLNP
jgi:hypothetical protein